MRPVLTHPPQHISVELPKTQPTCTFTTVKGATINPVVVAQLLAKGTNTHKTFENSLSALNEGDNFLRKGAIANTKTASVRQVADGAMSVWLDIDTHLSPIIGAGGMAAIYKRTLYLTSKDYPCLRRPLALFQPAEYNLLYLALLAQERSEAIAANGAMLRIFSRLLAGLIGVSLTERLLLSILEHPSHRAP